MIKVINFKDRDEGNDKAHDILVKIVSSDTLLALSGGTSPDYLRILVKPNDISPGVVCMVDERYGEKLHPASNEVMLADSEVVKFLDFWGVPFYPILSGKSLKETGEDYEKQISKLFDQFKKRVGVMGIGSNLHTAGIFPNSDAAHSPKYVVSEKIDDKYPERISFTLKALGEFQEFVILAFGQDKKEAIRIVLNEQENDIQKYPAIFYRKAKAKVYLITDQNI